MRILSGAAVAAAALVAVVSTPAVALADTASSYNLFVLGDMNVKSSDTEGRVAVKGAATLDSYSVGAKAAANTVNLVVGGNLKAGVNGGGSTKGLTDVGGTATFKNWSSAGTTANMANLPVDFASETGRLDALADYLAAYTPTGTIGFQYGTMTLTGTSTGLNVFDISAAMLAQTNTFKLNMAPGGMALINVDGTNDKFSNAGIYIDGGANGATTYASSVLWNFSSATKLSFSGISMIGSVLAPNADYQGGWGQLNGELIVKSFSDTLGATQINTGSNFRGNLLDLDPRVQITQMQTAIPEPATWALMIAGFGLAGGLLRRRRAALA